MNGPQHYVEAERLVSLLGAMTEQAMGATSPSAIQAAQVQIGLYVAAGQVHATLALVAATADARRDERWRPVLQ